LLRPPRLTVTGSVFVAVLPPLSVTLNPTLTVPAVVKACVVLAVEPAFTSYVPLASKSHSYLAIEPSGSDEVEPLKVALAPATTGLGLTVKAAVGGWLSMIVSVFTERSVAPPLSVTRRRTSTEPSAL
jgi:hypothetical protein